jgi:RNA polymerase sigma-70 factor (ECF subfamily)
MPDISPAELKALVYNIAVLNCEASYKRVFALLFNPLFRFSFAMLRCRQSAEEITSDVMFKLWQKRVELLEVEHLQVYALVIARNLCLNSLKKNSSAKVVSLSDSLFVEGVGINPEQILINAQNKAKLNNSINALPTRCRLVFKLIKEEGLNYKEAAEVLNISPKTVDAHLVTAMKKLSGSLWSTSSAHKKYF